MNRQRAKVVPRAKGIVLELGLGTGQNLPHYHAPQVERVIGVDPCDKSWELAQERVAQVDFDVEFQQGSAEQLRLESDSVHTVLLTFALCTIPDPAAALAEARRVLAPDGLLLFCEHGKAPDPEVERWQHRINPLWKRLAGGCHLNRDVPELIASNGFSVVDLQQMYLPGTPRVAGFNVWGAAVPR